MDHNIRFSSGILVCLVIGIILGSYVMDSYHKSKTLNHAADTRAVELEERRRTGEVRQLLNQRNQISRQLNKLQERYGQLSCEARQAQSISDSGGWCIKNTETGHLFDAKVADSLSIFLANKTVVSFGDGPGKYKKYILSTGRVLVYDAYDGAPFSYNNTGGAVQFLDLALEQYGLPVYDWVVSLEVIEHIPAKFEDIVLSNFVRHAREGLVVSWALEGQPGFHHVNCRNFDYVLQKFKDLGFYHDAAASTTVREVAKFFWFKENINVFRRMAERPFDDTEI